MAKEHYKPLKKCSFVTGRKRSPRPRTFKTEESAKKWADTQGLKNYQLQNLRTPESSTKKLRIVSN